MRQARFAGGPPSSCAKLLSAMRWFTYLLGIFSSVALLAEDELPQDPEEPLDIEPPLLIQEVPTRGPAPSTPTAAAALDPDQIQVALEKARKNAAAGERLFRTGIIARVDVENRALKILRLEADLANARLEKAREQAESKQSRFDAGEIPPEELEQAKSALALATNEESSAAAKRDKAELDEALLNLSRQKKLLALGSGRKADVSRAEEKVNALQQQQH